MKTLDGANADLSPTRTMTDFKPHIEKWGIHYG